MTKTEKLTKEYNEFKHHIKKYSFKEKMFLLDEFENQFYKLDSKSPEL